MNILDTVTIQLYIIFGYVTEYQSVCKWDYSAIIWHSPLLINM